MLYSHGACSAEKGPAEATSRPSLGRVRIEERRVGTELAYRVGATATLTKQLSEADIALFVLVTGDAPLASDEPPDPRRQARQVAPLSLLSALLTNVAAHLAPRPAIARLIHQTIQVREPAYTDDTVTATAEVVEYDRANHALAVRVRCDNHEGRRLAEGEMLLRED
jgi:acyl dehydratase